MRIWSLFTVKLWHLALADAAMVASTAVSLPLQRALRGGRGGLTWAGGGMALMSAYEVAWLAVWIRVPFALDWTWTAQGLPPAARHGHAHEDALVRLLQRPSVRDGSAACAPSTTRTRPPAPRRTSTPAPKPWPSAHRPAHASRGLAAADGQQQEEDEDEKSANGAVAAAADDEVAQLREDLARELTQSHGQRHVSAQPDVGQLPRLPRVSDAVLRA